MKFVLAIMCVLAGVVTAEKEVVKLPPNILQTALACMAETGVNPEILTQLGNPKVYEKNSDKRVHKFINCTFSKLGYAKKNGHVRVDRVIEVFYKDNMDSNKKAALKIVMDECNKETGSDASETTFKIFGCFIKHSSVKLALS